MKEDIQYGCTRYTFPVGDRQGKIVIPKNKTGAWVWYAPSFVPGLPGDRQAWYAERMMKAGFAFGGVDVGESMGNPAGREIFSRYHDFVTKEFGLDRKVILYPQSRGTLMHYNWAAENPEKVQCIAGVYNVCDLRSYPKLDKAAEAYGMSRSDLEADLANHNPVDRLQPLVDAGIPVFHIHGDADELVPLGPNSAELVKRYRALGGKAHVKVVPGKGHEEVDEFFTDEDWLGFVLSKGETFPK